MEPSRSSEGMLSVVNTMADSLLHRGPDGRGAWVDSAAGIALGFRRLAIVELSHSGDQPMASNDGRWIIVFNGEIYNHLELRAELSLKSSGDWRGRSDTETLVEAISVWGIQEAIIRCNGMFAVAAWDRKRKELWLARDRIGKKPLYYGWQNSVFLFGSELKALRCHPAFRCEINRNALALYLRHSYIPNPYSIYTGVSKLQAGVVACLQVASGSTSAEVKSKCYWSVVDMALNAEHEQYQGNVEDGDERVDAVIREAVKRRMIADVPLGAFLSGGIDSSLVVSYMQEYSDRPVKAFCIGFEDSRFDESNHAIEAARVIGCQLEVLKLSARGARDIIPRLAEIYDEPFADSSQIPTALLCQLARRNVTVAVSGDGGDEAFGGYARYSDFHRRAGHFRLCPRFARVGIGRICGLAAKGDFSFTTAAFTQRMWKHVEAVQLDKVRGLSKLLQNYSEVDLYRYLVSYWKDSSSVVLGARDVPYFLSSPEAELVKGSAVARGSVYDIRQYLVDDILVKVDRASMAASLEVRCPLLDYKLLEFSFLLPAQHLSFRGLGKPCLRRLLKRRAPGQYIDRPKMGFGLPIGDWLRTDLRLWAEDLLDVNMLSRQGFLCVKSIREVWAHHLSGRADLSGLLWPVLQFQAWYDLYGHGERLLHS